MRGVLPIVVAVALTVGLAPAAEAKPYARCKAGPELKGKLRIRGNVTCAKARYVICGWYFTRGTTEPTPMRFACHGLGHTWCYRTGGAIRFDGELVEC